MENQNGAGQLVQNVSELRIRSANFWWYFNHVVNNADILFEQLVNSTGLQAREYQQIKEFSAIMHLQVDCRQFCKGKYVLRISQWANAVFSDETKFSFDGLDVSNYYWHDFLK